MSSVYILPCLFTAFFLFILISDLVIFQHASSDKISGVIKRNKRQASQDALYYLDFVHENIEYSPSGNVVLIFGNDRIDSNILAHFLAGDIDLRSGRQNNGDFAIFEDLNEFSSPEYYDTNFNSILDTDTNLVYHVFSTYGEEKASLEIATKYFLKTILSNAGKIKIILALDHDAISLETIASLLKFSSEFITNVDHFRGSATFIINRVPFDVSDDSELSQFNQEIEELLFQTKEYFENDTKISGLVDILATLDENNKLNLGYLSKPVAAGKLNTMQTYNKQKRNLSAHIENLQFETISADDFDFHLSKESEETISEILITIKSDLTSTASEIAKRIELYYNRKLEESNDVLNTLDSDIIPHLTKLKGCFFSQSKLEDIVICVAHYQSDIQDLSSSYKILYKNLNYLKILEQFTTQDVSIAYAKPVDDLQQNLNVLLNDLILWQKPYHYFDKFLKIYRYLINIDDILTNYGEANVTEYVINTIRPSNKYDPSRINVLKKMLHSGTTADVRYICEGGGKLTVEGHVLILSRLKLDTISCNGGITNIEFFALKKIFLDSFQNLNARSIFVVSPEIEVIHPRQFIQFLQNLHETSVFGSFGFTKLEGMPSRYRMIFKSCDRYTYCKIESMRHVLARYKNYLIKNINDVTDKTHCLKFYKELNQVNIEQERSDFLLDFMEELAILENDFYTIPDQNDLLAIYDALQSKIIKQYDQTGPEKFTGQYLEVLKRLHTFVLTKIYAIQNIDNENLVVDIEEYLNIILDSINNLENGVSHRLIESYRDAYNGHIDAKIEDAKSFISDYLLPEMKQISQDANKQIEQLLMEIVTMSNALEKDENHLREKREQLKKQIEQHAIIGTVSLVGSFIGSIFGIVGMLVSYLATEATSLIIGYNPKNIQITRQLTSLPPGVRSLIEQTKNDFRLIEDERIEQLQNRVDAALHVLKNHRPQLERSYLKISRINYELRQIKLNKIRLEDIDRLTEVFDAEKEYLKSISRRSKRSINAGATAVYSAISVADTSVTVFNTIKDDESKLVEIDRIIQETKVKENNLKQYERNIRNIMQPTLKNMETYVMDLSQGLSTQSEAGLLVSKLEMKNLLSDIGLEMMKMTNGFSVEQNLYRDVERIIETMTTVIDVYGRMEQYVGDKYLANYITDVKLAGASCTSRSITDPRLKDAVCKLDEMIKSNIILAQYQRAVSSFKQHVFPFAYLYNADFNLTQEVSSFDDNFITTSVKRHIELLLEGTVRSRVLINRKIDNYVHEATFDSNYRFTKPFYVWKNRDYNLEISNLLDGKAIFLYADILEYGGDKNAIKFDLIGIKLKHRRKQLQSELDETLKNYKVSMKHMGNSKYKCDDNYYVITSDDQEIEYSFETNENGSPVDRNMVYNKIRNGTILLSPFALWRIQLTRHSGHRFSELAKYKNKVDLQLVGHGRYVKSNSGACKQHLENHYMLDSPYHSAPPVY